MAAAKPASPNPVEYLQPDGSKIMIRLFGDERAHYATTADGFLLTFDNNGTACYASANSDGSLTSSHITATDASSRSPQATAWLRNNGNFNNEALLDIRSAKSRIKNSYSLRAPGISDNSTRALELCESSFPHFGSPKALVILVEYSDTKFKLDNPYEYFSNLLSQEGFSDYNATGSVLDWFKENSKGQFSPEFDLYGPIELPNRMSYYGGNDLWGNDNHPEDMAIHALEILDEDVDFSQYDTDDDGKIDNVYIFYAGFGEADGGGADTVWPHSWDVASAGGKRHRFDGVLLDHYACSNETDRSTRKPDGIGTFVHEFSHVLGLPDLYSTNSSNAFTPGNFSVLDYGPYNNNGRTPPNYSSFELMSLDWLKPALFEETREYMLSNLSDSHEAYMLPTEQENEFFLFENRQRRGNDAYLPGHGMLVWHIDYNKSRWESNSVNNSTSHQYVDLVEADNNKTSGSRAGDPFPGSKNVTSFDSNTLPALKSWKNNYLGFGLYDIREEEGLIYFNGILDENLSSVKETGIGQTTFYSLIGKTVRAIEPLTIYDTTGATITVLQPGDTATLAPKGIYILKSDNQRAKIAL